MKTILGMALGVGLAAILTLAMHGQLQMAEQIATFERQLDYLQMRLGERPAARSAPLVARHEAATGTQSAAADAPATTRATVADDSGTNDESAAELSAAPAEQASVADPPLHPALERGYIYAQDWEDMEQSVASMSAAAKKRHWDRVFQAIEAGELEVYDE